jgi:hypothetical protein
MSNNLKNPAARLLAVWDRMPQSSGGSVLLGWAASLDIPHDDPHLFQVIGSMYADVDQSEMLLKKLRQTPLTQKLRGWIPAFREAVRHFHPTGDQWPAVFKMFTLDRRTLLDLSVGAIDDAYPDDHCTKNDLDRMVTELDALAQSIHDSNELSDDVRKLLLDLLQSVRTVIARYHIRGRASITALLADIALLTLHHNATCEAAEKTPFWSKIMKPLVVIASVTYGVAEVYQLGYDINESLPNTINTAVRLLDPPSKQ